MLVGIIGSGKFEVAMMIPEKDEEAVGIFNLSMVTCFLVATVFSFCLILFSILDLDALHNFSYLFTGLTSFILPIYILCITLNVLLTNWVSRNKKFKLLSIARILRFTSALAVSLVLGFLIKSFLCLLIGDLVGIILGSGFIYWSTIRKSKIKILIDFSQIKLLAYKYREFPKFSLLSSFINKLITQSPIFLLNLFFTPVHVGNYGMCERLLGVPISLISEASSNVFRGELSSGTSSKSEKKIVFYKALRRLVALAIPIFFILYHWGGQIILWIFDDNWSLASTYTKYLVFPLAMQFIFTPITFVLFYYEKLRLELLIQICSFLLLVCSVFFYMKFLSTDIDLIILLSANTFVRVLLEFWFSKKIIEKN
jgi:O-antigen/teichoic acid export membrane protein